MKKTVVSHHPCDSILILSDREIGTILAAFDILIEDKINVAEPNYGKAAEINIIVDGGLIESIDGIPAGVIVNVKDFDIDGDSPFQHPDNPNDLKPGYFKSEESGDIYRLDVYTGNDGDDAEVDAEVAKWPIPPAQAAMMKSVGEYVEFAIDDNGNLRITLSPDGRNFLVNECLAPECQAYIDDGDSPDDVIITWDKDHASILWDLFENILVNSEWDLLNQNQIADLGHITSAPMITFGLDTDDNGKAIKADFTFWYPDYAVKSELEELLRDGFVVFQNAEAE